MICLGFRIFQLFFCIVQLILSLIYNLLIPGVLSRFTDLLHFIYNSVYMVIIFIRERSQLFCPVHSSIHLGIHIQVKAVR